MLDMYQLRLASFIGSPLYRVGQPSTQLKVERCPHVRSCVREKRRTLAVLLEKTNTLNIEHSIGYTANTRHALDDAMCTVDVVVEVLDARAPISTAHPDVPRLVDERLHIIALLNAELCPEAALEHWQSYLRDKGVSSCPVNARRARPAGALKKLIVATGNGFLEKRRVDGLLPRPVRCVVVGSQYVDTMSLINALVGKRSARSESAVKWISKCNNVEVLAMPVIVSVQPSDVLCALCGGRESSNPVVLAAKLLDELTTVPRGYVDRTVLEERLQVPLRTNVVGDPLLHCIADARHEGNVRQAAVSLLSDVRAGRHGPLALESPPAAETADFRLLSWPSSPSHVEYVDNWIQTAGIVVEVRDARAPTATSHPDVPTWVSHRAHIVAFSNAHLCDDAALRHWREHMRATGVVACCVDGRNVDELKQVLVAASEEVRHFRCYKTTRCLVLGIAGIGKSQIVDGLIEGCKARSDDEWIPIADGIELLRNAVTIDRPRPSSGKRMTDSSIEGEMRRLVLEGRRYYVLASNFFQVLGDVWRRLTSFRSFRDHQDARRVKRSRPFR